MKKIITTFLLSISLVAPSLRAHTFNDFFNSMFQWKSYTKANCAEKAGIVVGRGSVFGMGALLTILGYQCGKNFFYMPKKDIHSIIALAQCFFPAAFGIFCIAQAVEPINEDETFEEGSQKLLSKANFFIFLEKSSQLLEKLDKIR